ncbi:MAG: Ig-like domain-containing protein [Chitinivibrionales bacterium]|nr:Ig-like domain-containing protein [Chitinivibrionales bacterium]
MHRKMFFRAIFSGVAFAVAMTSFSIGSFAATTAPLASVMGIAMHNPTSTSGLDLAKADGLTWIRVDPQWRDIEQTPGVYNWSQLDQIVSLCQQRNLKVLFIFCYGNPLYTDPPTDQASVTAFARYAKAAAARYKDRDTMVRYEIWNEPSNIDPFPSGASYAALCRATADSVHKGDPSALVSSGGIARFDFGWEQSMCAAGLGNVDAIGIHEYWMNGWNGAPNSQSKPELVFPNMVQWRATYKQYLPNMNNDWMTEWGARLDQDAQNDQHRYAYITTRQMLCNWMVGLDISCIYCDGDDGYSLFGNDDNFKGSTLRRANLALQKVAAITGTKTIKSFLNPAANDGSAASNGIWKIVLTGSPTVEIVWVPNGTATVTEPAGTTCQDQYGDAVALTNNSVTMTEASGVYYFTLNNAVNVPVTKVSVSPATATIALQGTQQLAATITPADASNQTVTWSSSNTAIASVNASGLVTGVAAGSDTVTATTQDGGKTATSVITVLSTTATAFTVTSPTNGTTVSGTTSITGTTGPQWVNVAAYDLNNGNNKVALDVTPVGGAFTLSFNAALVANGAARIAVIAYSVPAGNPGGVAYTQSEIDLTLTVNNSTTDSKLVSTGIKSFSFNTIGNAISYALPKSCFVSIKYYDLQGRTVCSFVNNYQPSGYYIVDAPVASLLARNVYIREFRAGDFIKKYLLTVTK